MILITRPEKEACELAQILEDKGYDCLVEPMLTIKYQKPDWSKILAEPVQSFIATSKNGKRFAPPGQMLTSIPEEGKNAHELFQWLVKNLSPEKGKLVYLRGDIINFDMVAGLKKHDFKVEEVLTYQSIPPHDFSDNLRKTFVNLSLTTFFSAKTLINFLALIDKNKMRAALKKLVFLCISEEAATPLENYKVKRIHVADTPDLNGMINKIDEIY